MSTRFPVNLSIDEGIGPNPGLSLTHNAFWLGRSATGPCVYFMTETDNQADLLVYEATPASIVSSRHPRQL
jgi:hypothetical protein